MFLFKCVIRKLSKLNEIFNFSGEEKFNCMWLHRRAANVMEFQLGECNTT